MIESNFSARILILMKSSCIRTPKYPFFLPFPLFRKISGARYAHSRRLHRKLKGYLSIFDSLLQICVLFRLKVKIKEQSPILKCRNQRKHIQNRVFLKACVSQILLLKIAIFFGFRKQEYIEGDVREFFSFCSCSIALNLLLFSKRV